MPPKPPSLAETQRWLRDVLTRPEGPRAALASGRPGLLAWVESSPALDAAARLSVYADAYFLRLKGVLENVYPATRRLLGADAFTRLAAAYFEKTPPRSYNIEEAGRGLPSFLRRSREFGQPWLAETAALEWAVLEALYAERLPAPGPETFAVLAGPRAADAVLVFDPSLRLLESSWDVDELWLRRKDEAPSPGRPRRRRSPRSLAVWRDEVWVQVRPLEGTEARLLARLLEGRPLGRALHGLDLPPARLQKLSASWVREDLLKGAR